MSDDVRADARRLLQGITPGKWRHGRDNFGFHTISAVRTGVVYATGQPGEGVRIDNPADAEFIAAAPTLVDRLLAELDRERDRALRLAIRATGCEKAESERDTALATLQQVRELRREWGTKDCESRVYEMWKALSDILDGGAR